MPTLFVVAAVVAGAAGVVAWGWVCRRRPDVGVLVVLGAALFSAHLLALLYQAGVPADLVRALIPVKDLLAGVLAVALLLRGMRETRTVRLVAVPVALLLLVGLLGLQGVGAWPASDVALSARNLAVAALALLTATLLGDEERDRVLGRGLLLVTLAAAYALVEYALPTAFVRDGIGVGEYWSDVKEQGYHLSQQGTGLPGNFFTSGGVRRLSGSFGDPLAAGYVLAGWLVLGLLSARSVRRLAGCAVIAVALLLTFTRGGFILAGAALLPTLLLVALRGSWQRAAAMAGAVVAGVAGLLAIPAYREYATDVVTGQDDSTKGHLNALGRSGDYDYSLLGDGFGAAGGAVGRGTESVLVTVALQSGVVGIVLYLVATGLLLAQAGRRWSAAGRGVAFAGLAIGVLVTAVISEQLLTFNAGWVLGLVLGLAPSRTVRAGSVEDGREAVAERG